ncbi:MAG: ATP-binding protein [Candidatus Aquicultorales bacterium]
MSNSLDSPFNPLHAVATSESERYVATLMRGQINEIVGSYHHKFDHLYEAVQNAVDACEKNYVAAEEAKLEYSPVVEVIIDLPNNSLTVIDNGMGMATSDVQQYFFTPYGTLKSLEDGDGARQRGEKGVGATFLAYGSNNLHLTTIDQSSGELTSGCLVDALRWATRDPGKPLLPMLLVEPCEPHSLIAERGQGTAITIRFTDDTNLHSLEDHATDWKQWEAILRLYTALGYVDLADEDPFLRSLRANLIVIDSEGQQTAKFMQTGYLYPHLTTPSQVRLSSLTRRKGYLPASQKDMNIVWETFSREQLSDRITARMEHMPYLRHRKRDQISQILNKHQPEAYVCLASGSDFWESRNHEIWGTDAQGFLVAGMMFATKSQRIGESRRIDFSFRTGDSTRFFILVSMQGLKGDIGRKSLREDIVEFANFFANSIHSTFIAEDDCLKPSPGPFGEDLETDLEKTVDTALGRGDLAIRTQHITKIPAEEQDVVALFFDLLGSGKIRGYKVYSTHISRKYDGVGMFELQNAPENNYDFGSNPLGVAADKYRDGWVRSPSRSIFEFKYNSDGLVQDVRAGYKRFQDIRWLICWELGNRHTQEGIGLLDITVPAQINQRDYHGVTHLLTEHQSKVYVICLEKVIEILAAQEA